ncbi:MAG: N-(5'-phosphoribosyl)anthranilate isomerase [Deltaproteobacteria bacterium]|nr:MAG: N-(5'-phosphoribosyl)anthranilate isomerase [Deltaproteobacteria bacterium]
MIRIKICGLTRVEDALAAAEAGADAMGFIFAKESKRRASVDLALEVGGKLPPFITLVGVFKDQPLEEVRRIMSEGCLHVAQLHGKEDQDYIDKLGLPTLKALNADSSEVCARMRGYREGTHFLLDAGGGGAGRPCDWSLAAKAQLDREIILAGGLTPENVGDAVRLVAPWGVDTAGGVESSNGIKDHELIRKFIGAVREADAALERGDKV